MYVLSCITDRVDVTSSYAPVPFMYSVAAIFFPLHICLFYVIKKKKTIFLDVSSLSMLFPKCAPMFAILFKNNWKTILDISPIYIDIYIYIKYTYTFAFAWLLTILPTSVLQLRGKRTFFHASHSLTTQAWTNLLKPSLYCQAPHPSHLCFFSL